MEPDAETYAQRGWAYLLAYDAPRLALPDFEEAVHRDRANGDAYTGRGYALVQTGKYQAGVADADTALRQKSPAPRLLYNAARIYAQAAGKIDALPKPISETSREQRLRYQERALELIRGALRQQPADQRSEFWREFVEKDPALVPIARSAAFLQLAAEYGRR
jgi:tetratricopeptide (TPR) repeat protein